MRLLVLEVVDGVEVVQSRSLQELCMQTIFVCFGGDLKPQTYGACVNKRVTHDHGIVFTRGTAITMS